MPPALFSTSLTNSIHAREHGNAPDQIKRPVELVVTGLALHRLVSIRRRGVLAILGFFAFAVTIIKSAAQISLTAGFGPGNLFDLGQFNDNIRIDTNGLNGTTRWREIPGRGQAHGALLGQGHDGLHRTFAEGLRAQQYRPVVILQGAGNNFRGRG